MRPFRRRQLPHTVTGVALESLLIAFGVILALGANEWREARQNRRLAESSLQSIHEELSRNREELAISRDYHGGLRRMLQERAQAGETAPPSLRDFPRGFVNVPTLLTTAWETAKATDAIQHLPLATVLTISEVYELQDRYQAQSRAFAPVLYEEIYRSGSEGVVANWRNLASVIASFWWRESELLGRYDAVLGAWGSQQPADAATPASS